MRPRKTGPSDPWARFEPTEAAPWNLDRVAHLHRRAGFAARWGDLQRDLADGPDAAIDRILGAGSPPESPESAAFEATHRQLDRYAAASGNLVTLQAAWLSRMIQTPDPLRERMTLFWHNHFATSHVKVANTQLMRDQIALLREQALGDFPTLLKSIARDPAMLVWLDSATNRKAHPNENYAREVMELFTLGRGHYSEKDIQEAARAFTGNFIQSGRFIEVAAQHDAGVKTILGRSGAFRGDDVAEILLDQDACAPFVCRKLFKMFVNEIDEPGPELIAPLAAHWREHRYQILAVVEMILRSRLFFESGSIRRRIKSPVELTVGTLRALEVVRPTVSLDALAGACTEMGQSLYAPPSVAGWEGGAAWINTASTLARTNFALSLLSPSDEKLGGRFAPRSLASRHGRTEPGEIGRFYLDLLLQGAGRASLQARLGDLFERAGSSDDKLREAVGVALSAAEYQLS